MKAYETEALMRRRLRQIRKAKGVTHKEMAKRTGLSKSGISEIESGRVNGRLSSWLYLAEVLGVTLADLCTPDGGGGSIEKKADH